MRNESSLFTRAGYLEQMAADLQRPIGKDTPYAMTHYFMNREFVTAAMATHTTQHETFAANTRIYPHNVYEKLFLETLYYERADSDETPPSEPTAATYDLQKPILIHIYDLINDQMLFVEQDKKGEKNEEAVNGRYHLQALPTVAKKRLHTAYGINAFPYSPFGTIEEFLTLVPTDHNLVNRTSSDDPRRNDEQGRRMRWIKKYIDTMFEIKGHDFETDYALPLFGTKEIICKRSPFKSEHGRDWLEIHDIENRHILNVYSEHHHTMSSNGYREYEIVERGMTAREVTITKNVIFLSEKNHILRPNTVLDLQSIDLPSTTLPNDINVSTIPVLQPK